MLIPKYWSQASTVTNVNGKPRSVKRYGWSNESEALAQQHAQERINVAITQIQLGNFGIDLVEPKVPYNGAEGVPIREEILSEHGASIITRNSYGAKCLNTPNVLFADVDFEKPTGKGYFGLAAASLFLGTFILSWWLTSGLWWIACAMVALLGINPLARKLHALSLYMRGGVELLALNKIKKFMKDNPSWGMRLYKTPAGFRLLVTHKTFDPRDPEVTSFFQAIDSDPLYVMMCKNQRCFRARLSAKPWRAGLATHMRPRPGVWPIRFEMLPIRVKWIQEYELVASNFAACRYQASLGSNAVDPAVQLVMDLHDAMSRAHATLPLA